MKVWATMEFTNDSGKHEVGDDFDLPRNTDEEKAEFERLINQGIVTTNRPKGDNSEDSGGSRKRS